MMHIELWYLALCANSEAMVYPEEEHPLPLRLISQADLTTTGRTAEMRTPHLTPRLLLLVLRAFSVRLHLLGRA